MAQDYYAILGVSQDATTQEIKRAFRQIARECHPDVSGGEPAAEERFKAARKAYETLMDPVTRARYDRRGQRRRHAQGGSFFDAFYERTKGQEGRKSGPSYADHVHGGGSGAGRKSRYDPGNDLDLEDLFNGFGDFGFGQQQSRGSTVREGSTTSRPPPQRGKDVHIDLEVDHEVARTGGSVTAVYYRLQRADSWRPGASDPGVVRVQDIADVRVLPSTRDGEIMRERGLGDAGAYGGPYGDLVIRVRVRRKERPPPPPPPKADTPTESTSEVEADEAFLDIGVVEAMLGGRVDLDTPQGRVRVTIPPGTSGGTRMRLKRRGRYGPDGEPTDLYVTVRIQVPRELDEESRKLIEEFSKLNPGA